MPIANAANTVNLNIVKQCFSEQNKFITHNVFTKYTNIITKLKWKLFTKGIKRPSKEAWVCIDSV